jgi:hypothetical protein
MICADFLAGANGGNRQNATLFGYVASEFHLVAHVGHELRIVVRGEIARHRVNLAPHVPVPQDNPTPS